MVFKTRMLCTTPTPPPAGGQGPLTPHPPARAPAHTHTHTPPLTHPHQVWEIILWIMSRIPYNEWVDKAYVKTHELLLHMWTFGNPDLPNINKNTLFLLKKGAYTFPYIYVWPLEIFACGKCRIQESISYNNQLYTTNNDILIRNISNTNRNNNECYHQNDNSQKQHNNQYNEKQ